MTLFEGSPNDKVNIADVFANKKGVLFAVPGAFTPGCSKVCEQAPYTTYHNKHTNCLLVINHLFNYI